MIKHEPILSSPNVDYVFYAHLIMYQEGQESKQKLENNEVLVTNKKYYLSFSLSCLTLHF
jgi:hypothetical protein